ncbi:hypothetical protein ACLOJK_040911 [Asimina triloba]
MEDRRPRHICVNEFMPKARVKLLFEYGVVEALNEAIQQMGVSHRKEEYQEVSNLPNSVREWKIRFFFSNLKSTGETIPQLGGFPRSGGRTCDHEVDFLAQALEESRKIIQKEERRWITVANVTGRHCSKCGFINASSALCFDHRRPAVSHCLNEERSATARQRGRAVVPLPLTEAEKADGIANEESEAGSARATAGTDY